MLVAVTLVLRGSGNLQRDPEVVVAIPASAGLITGEAPVRYSGVNIGRISGIDSGTQSSVVRLQIDAAAIGQVPSSVRARVVPRTFFGTSTSNWSMIRTLRLGSRSRTVTRSLSMPVRTLWPSTGYTRRWSTSSTTCSLRRCRQR
ncbi:MlaD family protein [Rhodococcus sp. MTM3W5.2]|uniref:MlaD family protein n=1 Tax=Rhodococcus sp. MTM3W5.2 TaxID=1805827 RepID=UPI001CB93820|nr:MlaD family protein [Rhodococcus sp. MTM3W5.2]